jgi:hypothetical protein
LTGNGYQRFLKTGPVLFSLQLHLMQDFELNPVSLHVAELHHPVSC